MKLKNCNLYKMPLLDLLQLIANSKKYDRTSITPIRKELHWLPVEERIVFKNLPIVKKI